MIGNIHCLKQNTLSIVLRTFLETGERDGLHEGVKITTRIGGNMLGGSSSFPDLRHYTSRFLSSFHIIIPVLILLLILSACSYRQAAARPRAAPAASAPSAGERTRAGAPSRESSPCSSSASSPDIAGRGDSALFR